MKRDPNTGQLILIIRTEDSQKVTIEGGILKSRENLNEEKVEGSFKSGGNSFVINGEGIKPFFTLASFDDDIATLQDELKIIRKINSPLSPDPLSGTPRDYLGKRRMSISVPRAKGNCHNLSFKDLEGLFLAITSFALSLRKIHHSKHVHLDLKSANLLFIKTASLKSLILAWPLLKEKGHVIVARVILRQKY